MAAEELYFDSICQIRLPRWSRGRVTLIGDAASGLPLWGDGSSQATIEAYLLAGELAAAYGDHHTAYAQYERTHRPRVRAIQRNLRIARPLMVPATTGAIWRRNQLSRLSHLLPAIGWLQHLTKSNSRTLPDGARSLI